MALYWRFTDTAIESVPEAPGVYAFFAAGGKLIHLGSATKSLRAVFRSHWKGLEGRETCGAEYISWEANTDPMKLEAELVDRDLPLNFHPAAVRASTNVTPFGAVSVPA